MINAVSIMCCDSFIPFSDVQDMRREPQGHPDRALRAPPMHVVPHLLAG